MAYTQAEHSRDDKDLSAARWAEELTIPVENIFDKKLYVVAGWWGEHLESRLGIDRWKAI